ncbi:acidic ribosomal protein P0 [Halogeometricum borinquense DSM 11551]|uniref:Large ribosomal subunit protein uL10 n=1 Tax=Halogeometricum borinquense (strain ATCC 700274 / DSM 11551 / JCM 10706 / KCTC 4070 / PR3) TaxID=469382 RepID=E4NR77_HALBP|nr:50S ribosomal protein L10 [Halogeometricum borinquense]ADQ66813.1 LSU ribosomal protein L10P [Halogeometricum borinquense DSM 11551]ELY30321.1 acidic ribosomal protein P0 [Halogeometricum borinquense DSM 11551]
MSESESVRKTETIPEWKRIEVGELTDFLEEYQSVGVVSVTGIPSRQLQSMRRDLHGSAELRMSRNTLVTRALEQVNDGLEELTDYVYGQVALVGTNDNPFGLYKQLEASKTPAPINAGEVAPNDIVIPEGDTGVDPGPFVGELQQVGASARIMEGSIKVTEDSHVLDEGEVVSEELSNVLNELGIEPKEVGLDLRGVYSEGVLFEPDELAIDVEEYRADIQSAAAGARNLSINAGYPTAQTAPTMLAKAAGEAKALGLFAAIEDPELVPDLIAKADAQLRTLAAQIDDEEALPEELRGVEAPAAAPADEADEDESTDEEDTEAEADDTDDDDEDDGDGAEGLGAMFG